MGDQWRKQTMNQERKAGGPPQTSFIDLTLGMEHRDMISILERFFWLQWKSLLLQSSSDKE